MKVTVRGVGNIGTTLANMLLAHRELLGIDDIALWKSGVASFDEASVDMLRKRGARIVVGSDDAALALDTSGYLFDCRAAGMPLSDREAYAQQSWAGVSAQGTEMGFGVPFVAGVNDEVIRGERFVQVASCNTHATSTLVRIGRTIGPLVDADFVVVRRSEDVGSHERLVASTVVARHREAALGTHHAVDAARVLATVGVDVPLTSSDATTPTQLLHSVRFRFRYASVAPTSQRIHDALADHWLGTTELFDSNRVFELGRRYGFQGRLYEHAIVVANNLLVTDDTVAGWAFVPQEGNTILSTIAALLLQSGNRNASEVMAELRDAHLRLRW